MPLCILSDKDMFTPTYKCIIASEYVRPGIEELIMSHNF